MTNREIPAILKMKFKTKINYPMKYLCQITHYYMNYK